MRNSGVELAVTNSEKTDVKTNERHTQQNEPSTTKGNFHTVKFPIPKKQDVFNEFEENPFLFYSAFPFIFLLGKGLQKKGTLPKTAIRHLLLQYDTRAASCLRLAFLLFNQKQRHAAAEAIAAAVKMQPKAFTQFGKWVSDQSFVSQLRAAQEDPTSKEAKSMIQKVMKHLSLVNKKIPYTVAERKGSMSRLYALVYHFGMPSIYFPFSPDDTFTTMNIRLSYPQLDNEDFPAKEKGLAETLKGGKSEFKSMKITNKALRTLLASGNGAVAAAEVFSQIVEAVFSDLIGMPSTSEAKKTILLPGRLHGAFGTATAAFGVTENQDRGSLHMHIVRTLNFVSFLAYIFN